MDLARRSWFSHLEPDGGWHIWHTLYAGDSVTISGLHGYSFGARISITLSAEDSPIMFDSGHLVIEATAIGPKLARAIQSN